MNKLIQCGSVVAIIVLMLGVGIVKAQLTIGGVEYMRSGPGESVTAPFTTPDGGVTTGSFSGLVELSVSGTGESSATQLNDAFWVFTDLAHAPITPYHQPSWYQLSVDTQTLLAFNHKHAKLLVVYDVDAGTDVVPPYIPAYRADHTYNIVINLGAITPSSLHFGVSDGNFADNSGAYQIMVYQLAAVVDVDIDIKPGSCPNPLNVRSKGVLPVAILGSEDFDVGMIDVASIRLAGVDPNRSSYEDVAAPVSNEMMAITLQEEPCHNGDCDEEPPCQNGDCDEEPPCQNGDCDEEPCHNGDCDEEPDEDECDCTTAGPDDYLDLTLKFKTQDIVQSLGEVVNGEVLILTLTGVLSDGTPIEGEDCIRVKIPRAKRVRKAKKPKK